MDNQALLALGWSEWFAQKAEGKPAESLARVVAVDRRQYWLLTPDGPYRAKLAGSFLHRHRQVHEHPCVGDWVGFDKPSGDGLGTIHTLIERRTSLRRKSAGRAIKYQMIAANVDYVVIVQSCQFDFNLKRLERYLVMVRDGGAEPLILLTKTDLVDPAVTAGQLAEISAAGIAAPVLTLSNVTRAGLDAFQRMLEPGKTYCFVGSSGVGKSTLINHLSGEDYLDTQEVSETGEGRHTTVRRELIRLETGALVIDNPGMREFGVFSTDLGIENGYSGITDFAAGCRYRDCGHTNEPGCAVLAAVESGALNRELYNNYLKLREESEFYQLSYVQKRRKDRSFGRFLKSAKKDFEDE